MEYIVRRLIESRRLEEARGDTTLRQTLEILADEFNIENYDSTIEYCLHHKNGNHDENKLYNLVLMPSRRHNSYHTKLNRRGIDKQSKEALELFDKEYANDCVFVGEFLYSKLILATQEVKTADSECLE